MLEFSWSLQHLRFRELHMEHEIRADRSSQGRKKLHAEPEKFFELINGGVEFRAAAKIVGVNDRTTKVSRHGERQKKPGTSAITPLRPRSYRAPLSSRFLSKSDRIFIADSLRAGWSLRKIAAELGRPASTISREVPRNSHPRSDDYGPYAAHDRAIARLP